METQLLYMTNAVLFKTQAKLLEVGTDEKGRYLVLDKTIFYPQGGGQPADQGKLSWEGGVAEVVDVRFVEGVVLHYVAASSEEFAVGSLLELEVNAPRRLVNTKAHSAGHLIQAVVDKMGVGLKAVKGFHFPEGSYVQFSGPMPANPEEFLKEVNARLSAALSENQPIEVRMVSAEDVKAICPNLPYTLPEGKPLRVVKMGALGEFLPCGGTHLTSTGELKELVVTKLKAKDGEIRMNYQFK